MVLLLIVSYLNLSGFQDMLRASARKEIKSSAEKQARIISQSRDDLIASLVALAEQRELRQGIAKLNAGSASPQWCEGYLAFADAALRYFLVTHSGVENLALRALDGRKIAGSGAETDSISYPDIQQRFSRQRLTPSPEKLRERWVVPVRDVEAQPLAFLVAQVNPAGWKKAVLRHSQFESDLVCLEDSGGVRIWDSHDSLRIPRLDDSGDDFNLNDERYILARSKVPGTNWILTVARPPQIITDQLRTLKMRSAVSSGIGIILLIIFSLVLARRAKTHTSESGN